MNGLVIGVYGLYLILVGMNGNAGKLATNVQADAPKFLPWIIAIFVLAFLNGSSETGRKVTGPFITLVVLSFILKRFDTLKGQTIQLWDMAGNATSSSSAPPSPDVVGPNTSGVSTPAPNASGFSSFTNPSGASDALYSLENLLG